MEQNLPTTPSLPNKPMINPKILIISLAIVILIAGLLYYLKNRPSLVTPTPEKQVATTSANLRAQKAIAKVGDEIIYQDDLDHEVAIQPQLPSNKSAINTLLKKIASDSAILQGASTEGLTLLDQTVYNSTQKDYAKRVKLVQDLEAKIRDKATQLSGEAVSIWFYNTKPGALGLEKSKQVTFDKITKLHDDVKSGRTTIQQAAENIKNDTSLAQIDPAYKTNASFGFKVTKGQPISFVKQLDDALWALNPGQVTNVITGQDKHANGKTYDALYIFGQVKEKNTNSNALTFEEWLKEKLQKYALTIY